MFVGYHEYMDKHFLFHYILLLANRQLLNWFWTPVSRREEDNPITASSLQLPSEQMGFILLKWDFLNGTSAGTSVVDPKLFIPDPDPALNFPSSGSMRIRIQPILIR